VHTPKDGFSYLCSLNQLVIFFPQLFLGFLVPGVFGNTFHRADFHALWHVKMAHAFGTQRRVDLVYLDTLVDGLVWTFGFTYIAVDALFGD
jgi:hypothetical protein